MVWTRCDVESPQKGWWRFAAAPMQCGRWLLARRTIQKDGSSSCRTWPFWSGDTLNAHADCGDLLLGENMHKRAARARVRNALSPVIYAAIAGMAVPATYA